MSWSSHIKIPKGSDGDTVSKMIREAPVFGNDDCPEERDYAVQCAKELSRKMLNAGLLGPRSASSWSVNLSGHVNKGHRKTEGKSAEVVNINITKEEEEGYSV